MLAAEMGPSGLFGRSERIGCGESLSAFSPYFQPSAPIEFISLFNWQTIQYSPLYIIRRKALVNVDNVEYSPFVAPRYSTESTSKRTHADILDMFDLEAERRTPRCWITTTCPPPRRANVHEDGPCAHSRMLIPLRRVVRGSHR